MRFINPETRGRIPRHEGEARVTRVYESRANRALVHNYFIARKYCVLSQYVANNYINLFPANTFFNDAYQTISDIQFIATGRVAPVTGYKLYIMCMCLSWSKKRRRNYVRACSKSVLGGKIGPVTPVIFILTIR